MLYPQYFIDDLKKTADTARRVIALGLLLIFVIFVLEGSAQEKPKAEKIDEFGNIVCEDLYARVDALQNALKNNPSATATVILASQKDSASKADHYRNFIERTFLRNGYAVGRLRIVRDPDTESTTATFWLVPAGADDPGENLQLWPEPKLDLSKPFIYGSEDENNICPTFVPSLYSDLINANPNVRGRIVVIPNSAFGERQKFGVAKEWMATLTQKYGVPRNRLKLFFGRPSNLEVVEFWIVPIKKK